MTELWVGGAVMAGLATFLGIVLGHLLMPAEYHGPAFGSFHLVPLVFGSLVGVIVSHVVVLFDFIEEAHERGEPLREALLDAGIVRLRPVMITVGATVIALFPLAAHGGPLWEPLCYAQIGGLTAATFITLLLVPVFYAICVLDLKIVKWETSTGRDFSHVLAPSRDQAVGALEIPREVETPGSA